MIKILMVCLGNICRSPLAEGILQSKVKKSKIFVDSAGTAAYHIGKLPDSRSIDIAKKYGIDLSNQRARKFTVSDFDNFNFIYAMDLSNYQNILDLARNEKDKQKINLILNELYPNENREIPDPYYGDKQGFEDVFEMLNDACDSVIRKKRIENREEKSERR